MSMYWHLVSHCVIAWWDAKAAHRLSFREGQDRGGWIESSLTCLCPTWGLETFDTGLPVCVASSFISGRCSLAMSSCDPIVFCPNICMEKYDYRIAWTVRRKLWKEKPSKCSGFAYGKVLQIVCTSSALATN